MHALQLEEYVLWRLRDVPGQRTLSAFRQQPGDASQAAERPSHIAAALPPSPYGKYAASAADTTGNNQAESPALSKPQQQLAQQLPGQCQPYQEMPGRQQLGEKQLEQQQPYQQQTVPDKHQAPMPASQPNATAASMQLHASEHNTEASNGHEAATTKPGSAQALNFDVAVMAQARASAPSEAETDPLSDSHAAALHGPAPLPSTRPKAGLEADSRVPFDDDGDDDDDADDAYGDAVDTAGFSEAPQSSPRHVSGSIQAESGAAPTATIDQSDLPAVIGPAADDYRVAHQRAAAARAACDLLRGPPKSSRDDPHFMDSYYKSSRLSFIGRWKARIEALTATMAAHAPLPQTAHQPSALINAFKGDKGMFYPTASCFVFGTSHKTWCIITCQVLHCITLWRVMLSTLFCDIQDLLSLCCVTLGTT